ncbi:stalk domain-containing protein [Herbivorax sp. ANBcel31]|uniref:copper amine oxidase N-terminal domain-containing protein n=1 Tax=Herbivorax sp. ANBcel31 TaxID=3069754 RepID=UPI0027AFFFF2|nr:copper amine oxidase N-terminal domain-containing protein [Herbivorax sp. ANBcel31]MDQ2085361.1 stalk domain-containing protein [Herbivorax sp. ANBcel31]
MALTKPLKQTIKNLIVLLIVFILCIYILNMDVLHANPSRPDAKDIPIGSLIIGSHIISFEALNNDLIDIALKSAEEHFQFDTYYKSEFANGTWFEITNASSFSDISTSGNAVSNSEINELTLTHWTRDDGATIDLESGRKVDLFRIIDYRNPNVLPELEELKTQREMILEMEDRSYEDYDKLNSINRVFIPVFSNKYNDKEMLMDKLTKYIEYLKTTKEEPDQVIEIPTQLRGNLNTEKILVSYEEVYDRLLTEAEYADKIVTKGEGDDRRFVKNAYTDLSTKYWSALDQVQKKIVELENQSSDSSPHSPILSEKKTASKNLLDAVSEDDYQSADTSLHRIYAINNILSNSIINIKIELSILDSLKEKEVEKLITLAKRGDSPQYLSAKNNGESSRLLASLKEENMLLLEEMGDNIEELTDYIKQRRSNPNDVLSLYQDIRSQYMSTIPLVPECDSQKEIVDYLNSLIDSLNSKIASIHSDLNKTSSEAIDELNLIDEQVKLLNEQYMDSIEKGDLELAASIERDINELSDKKNSIENQALENYKDLMKEKRDLEEQLKEAMDDEDLDTVNDLISQLDSISSDLINTEDFLDDKAKLMSELYEDTLNDLTDSILEGNYDKALNLANELANISDKLPDDFKGKEAKESDLNNLNKIIDDKYVDLVVEGSLDEADNLKSIQDSINQALEELMESIPESHEQPEKSDDQVDEILSDLYEDTLKELDDSIQTGDYEKALELANKLGNISGELPDSAVSLDTKESDLDNLNKLIDDKYKDLISSGKHSEGDQLKALQQSMNTALEEGIGIDDETDIDDSSYDEDDTYEDDTYEDDTYEDDSYEDDSYVDGTGPLLSDLKQAESSLGMGYVGDINHIIDLSARKHRLIVRLIILNSLKSNPEQNLNAIDMLMSDITKQLKELERQKYQSHELELRSQVINGYQLLPLENLIIEGSNAKHRFPIAVRNNTVFIPLRSLAESMRARVLWRPSTSEVTLVNNNNIFVFNIGSEVVAINGKEDIMPSPAVTINGATYVPLDYITRKLELESIWRSGDSCLVLYPKRLEERIK